MDKNQGGRTQQPREKGGNELGTRYSFALDEWLKEHRKDGPFSGVESVKAFNSGHDHAKSTALASGVAWDSTSSLGYIDNVAEPKNEDKAPTT